MRICKRRCHVFYVRTTAGEVRQANCSKRLRMLSPRACSTFLCFPPANFSTESLADADDAAQMRLLRLGFFRLRRPISIPVSSLTISQTRGKARSTLMHFTIQVPLVLSCPRLFAGKHGTMLPTLSKPINRAFPPQF